MNNDEHENLIFPFERADFWSMLRYAGAHVIVVALALFILITIVRH